MLLGDPQRRRRCRRRRCARRGCAAQQRGELGERARRAKALAAVRVRRACRRARATRAARRAAPRRDPRARRRRPRRQPRQSGARGAAASYIALRRVDDRPVAGAAAQVAGQRVVDVARATARARVLVQPEQVITKPGRAEAALRAMAVDHRLLHRMQRAVGGACRLSTVNTALPSSEGSNRMQALTGFHATRLAGALRRATTVHAPQSPSAQPSFVPVQPRAARAGTRAASSAARGRRRRRVRRSAGSGQARSYGSLTTIA